MTERVKGTYRVLDSSAAARYSISPEGHLFAARLNPNRKNYEICVLEPRTVKSYLERPAIQPVAVAKPGKHAARHEGLEPVSRVDILAEASRWTSLEWQPTRENLSYDSGKNTCTNVSDRQLPDFLRRATTAQTVSGVPYAWGCKKSLSDFQDELVKGFRAGDICSFRDPPKNCLPDVTGIDCSGFVAHAWKLKSVDVDSSHFHATYPRIELSSICPGDALVKPTSHVMLFAGVTQPRPGNLAIRVIDAAFINAPGRVTEREVPFRKLLGYVPIKRPNLVDAGDAQHCGVLDLFPPSR